MYQTTRQFGFPFTLKRTWIYVLFISNWRTAGPLTFVKPWQFSPPSVMFYFILPYLPLYIKCCTFPHTKGTKQKVKPWYICPAIPLPCQGIGCVVKTDWHIILIGREPTCSRKLMLEISVSGAFLGHFIEFPLWKFPLYEARGLALLREMLLEHFTGLKWPVKTHSINTINRIFLPKIKLNSKNPILASSSCTHMRIFVSTPLSMQKASPT